jgi:membrane-associated protease RseP (regulator of RpoE activity)
MNRRIWTLAAVAGAALLTAVPGGGQVVVEEIVCKDDECEVHSGDQEVRVLQRAMAGNRVMLGIGIDPVQGAEADEEGVHVTSVTGDGPAAEAGLRAGDIIISLDGHDLTAHMDGESEMDFDSDRSMAVQRLQAIMKDAEAGEPMALSYRRGGETSTTTITPEVLDIPSVITLRSGDGASWTIPEGGRIRVRPRAPRGMYEFRVPEGEGARVWSTAPGAAGVFRFDGGNCGPMGGLMFGDDMGCVDGVRMITLNPELGEYFGVESGVLVTEVDEESELGLRPGDVILRVGDREVRDPNHAQRILLSYEADEPVRITVRRSGRETTVEGRRD